MPSSTADRPSSMASTGPTIAITMRAAWFMTFAAASGNVTRTSIRDITPASGELRQHAVAESMHVVECALQGLRLAIAEQPHIDRGDAKVLKPLDIPDPVGVAAREQLGL